MQQRVDELPHALTGGTNPANEFASVGVDLMAVIIEQYFSTIDEILASLNGENYALAVKLASIPEDIRGYGHVKHEHAERARQQWQGLLDDWRNGRNSPGLDSISVEQVSA